MVEHLTDVTIEELQQALESVEEKTPTLRLIAAIAYKNGVTQSKLAEWFDVQRKTIYNWLTRFDEQDLNLAIRDKHRPGRPRKLSTAQFDELKESLHEPPTEVGLDVTAWTTDLVQQFIRERFEIDYSRSSCRRLMKETGMSYQTSRKAADDIDSEGWDSFEEELEQFDHVWMPN